MARMARQQEASLPGMAHFTSDQMFFIAFANVRSDRIVNHF